VSDTIEGRNAVLEALRSGLKLRKVFIACGVKGASALDEIERLARASVIRVEHVERAELDRKSERGAHQGVMAEMAAFEYAELPNVLKRTEDSKASLIVVLDHVTDPGNLGAIIRSVEVAGGDAVVVPKDRSATVTAVVHKTSAGATSHLSVVRITNIARTLAELKQHGYWVIGASEKASIFAWDAPLEGRVVLVMGAEGSGISKLVLAECDVLASLPVAGHVDSLNVAQAATVFAFEWARRTAK